MTDEVIDRVYHIIERQKCPTGFIFTSMDRTIIPLIGDVITTVDDDTSDNGTNDKVFNDTVTEVVINGIIPPDQHPTEEP